MIKMVKKYDYDLVVIELEQRACKLEWTKEEFNTKFKNIKTNINIISSCGCRAKNSKRKFIYV